VEEIVINDLCAKIAKELQNKMKITHIDVIVFNKKKMVFKTNNSAIVASTKLLEDLSQLPSGLNYSEDLGPGTKLQVLKKHKITICLELKTSEGFLGYILFGDKQSGQIYNEVDKKTLTIIAGELSIALENANAFLEISNFNTTLQHKVDSATSNLKQANLQLKELDEAKDEFISMASHQLRTPLTTVKGYVSMLDEGDFGKLTKEQQQTVGLVLDGSNRMARLIDDLLNISRMEAGKFYIDAQKLDLYKIVSEEFESLKNFADTKKVHIALVKPKSEIPIMLLDENKTRQVVMNLIDNAINYSQPPSGGGKVEITLGQVGKQIVFNVSDNGIGVPADQQPKLFTKMFRARNAQEVRPDGTGLGLYLVKRVIEDQGGKIIFQSKAGKGSDFGFSIPIHNSIKHNKSAEAKLKAQSNSAPE
ncbi:MAG: HAMP domain-containing sensor histidine kinase, partial [bacterium]